MLLSKTDKIRFKILYPEHSHNQLAHIFSTNREDVISMAKELGIYDPNKNNIRSVEYFKNLNKEVK